MIGEADRIADSILDKIAGTKRQGAWFEWPMLAIWEPAPLYLIESPLALTPPRFSPCPARAAGSSFR